MQTQATPISGKKFVFGAAVVVAIAVVIGVAAGGSNGSSNRRSGSSNRIDGSDLAMARFEGFADQICKCEDHQCQHELLLRMDRFQRDSMDEIKAFSDEQNEKVDELLHEIKQCVRAMASTH